MPRTHDDYTRNTLILRMRDTLREVLEHGCPEDAPQCEFCDPRVKWMGVRMGAVLRILDACQAELTDERAFTTALADDAERLITEARAQIRAEVAEQIALAIEAAAGDGADELVASKLPGHWTRDSALKQAARIAREHASAAPAAVDGPSHADVRDMLGRMRYDAATEG